MNHAIKPGNFVKVAFQGDASVTDNGIDLVTQKSVVINFDSGKINDNQYALHYAVDFAVKGTNTNEMEVGEYINRVQMVGSTKALAPTIISQVDTAEISDYRVEMTDLSGELYSRNQAVALRNSDYFTQSLMICGGSGGDVFRVIKDESCGWFYGGGEWSRTGGNFEYKGTGTNTMRYAGGAQKAIDANWNISLAGSLAQDWSKGYGGAWKSRSVTGQVGIAAKYSFDATKLSAGLSYSFSHSESQRAGVMLFDGTAETGRSTDVVGGILRLSHDFVSSGVYARPYMDLGLAYMTGYSAEEHGAGALNLQIRRNSEGHAWMRPGFELGYEGIIPGQGTLNLFANISLQQRLSGTATAAYSTLEGGPGGVDPMKALANLGETAFEVKTGLELKLDDFGTVGLHFEHRTAGNLHDNAARLNLSIPF
ncbi:autotransporter outer membrane beta-barrel domain-containing protein [Pseudovibrio sp. Tun.PSC04-5.I4]|uniref:autotransporter outer membrane beta-barrel domain-containing protein n=1 Tax=Pseudovibrio sp. Tun.PSC04-5.I4 TaxID=1798213 RepID=UPI000884255F|nr:autotransporter outer membrane beta-barrel domain-containing protein [Pseudovibrio sp. Tun.PSC04-5.I4]SDR45322.1 Autotransporter beta-domain-containing protein [Pseudovibrio sp. Tun.PSC04-5.I4]